MILGVVTLGLLNHYRGLPLNSVQTLRALPQVIEFLADRSGFEPAAENRHADEALARNREDVTHADRKEVALQQLRDAIGCNKPRNRIPDPGVTQDAYSWRDASGVMNFSDTAPADRDANLQSLNRGPREFFITVSAEQASLPPNFKGQIAGGAKRAYDQWKTWLGDDAIVRSHINVRLIGNADVFKDAYGKPNGDNWTATGFYRLRSNEALILYTPSYQATALSTAFHEVSHLITAWHLGPTPPWLNEGIAEHFETMQVAWQSATFQDNRGHLALLAKRGTVALEELTTLSRRDWTTEDAQRRYASAWSLIAFLMHSEPGTRTLREVLNLAYAQRCDLNEDAHSTVTGALSSYPGGTRALERDWQQWLQNRL